MRNAAIQSALLLPLQPSEETQCLTTKTNPDKVVAAKAVAAKAAVVVVVVNSSRSPDKVASKAAVKVAKAVAAVRAVAAVARNPDRARSP
jgi:hypothetical protein